MTMQLLELADLPAGLLLDGEIVALNDQRLPHFPLSANGDERCRDDDDAADPMSVWVTPCCLLPARDGRAERGSRLA
jgi:hypothetical protein